MYVRSNNFCVLCKLYLSITELHVRSFQLITNNVQYMLLTYNPLYLYYFIVFVCYFVQDEHVHE